MQISKAPFIAVSVIALSLLVSACGSNTSTGGSNQVTSSNSSQPIKIGFSITETGPNAASAEYDLRGYQLGAKWINDHGGLLGRKVELDYYDDQGTPSTSIQLYQKLITNDKVNLLVGPYETDLVSAIAPVVNRAKMVLPNMAANVDAFQGQYPYLVQTITQTPQYMVPVIDMAAAKGYKTMALLVQDTQFPKELADGVKKEAAAKGINVVFEETYPASTTDFTPLIMKVANYHPDIILGATYLADAEGIVKAAKASNVNAKLFAFSIGPVEKEFQSGLGPAANDIFGSTLWFPSLKTTGNQDFIQEYKAQFGSDPDYHAAMAFATMQVLYQAVKTAGTLDQDKIRSAMLNLDMDTVAGHFKVNQNGLQVGYQAYALQWQNGQQVLVWPSDAATGSPVLPHPAW